MSEPTEYQKIWVERISQIEEAISERLIQGVTPNIIIGTDRTLGELCEFLDVQPDWSNPNGRAIAFGDEGEIILYMYRVVNVDMPYGTIIIK